MELLHRFSSDISHITLPTSFNFPFYYVPHALALLAAKELQEYLRNQQDWEHDFGLGATSTDGAIGKMFGVLVVKDKHDKIGYLRSFSGKLADANHHRGFAPPVYDMLTEDGFFKAEERVLNSLNAKIEALEKAKPYLECKRNSKDLQERSDHEISIEREKVKAGKRERKSIRSDAINKLSPSEYIDLEEELKEQSLKSNYFLRDLTKQWKHKLGLAKEELAVFDNEINDLKAERKERSNALQEKLFRNYTFLNSAGNRKSLLAIFRKELDINPPAGAGECAAPKLLQFAFLNGLTPVTMAEFWWGQSPNAEVRKSGSFYPACRGKCEPILGHMLSETKMDANPLLVNPAKGKTIKVIYEDEDMAVIVKPAEFLSVPGKNITDSVQTRVRKLYPSATGPMIVHRLDMSTSGIMIIAKNMSSYKLLQHQFINRLVKKTYTAVLDGEVNGREGLIDLPLRVDLNDRPRQLVCYEHGKSAMTTWEFVSKDEGRTRVHFYPLTGRTHQLRVHAAHHRGLDAPILGDDLYGQAGKRLYLHAETIEFEHPITREAMKFSEQAPF